MELGYWKLNGNAQDESYWRNHGNITSVLFDSRPFFAGGQMSAYFNGSAEILVPNNIGIDPLGHDFYVEFWAHPENDVFTFVGKPGAFSVFHNITLQFTVTGTKGSSNIDSGVSLEDRPSHVIVSYRASTGDAAFFIDGQQVALVSGTKLGPVDSVNPLVIGTALIGKLDNVMLGLGIITTRQARLRFERFGGPADYESSVVFERPHIFIPLGEFIDDASGNGAPIVWSSDPVETDPIIYGMHGASVIGGESAVVDAPTGSFAVTMWFEYFDGLQLINYANALVDTFGSAVRLQVDASPQLSQTIRPGQLVMVTVVFDTNTRLFVNGAELASLPSTGTATTLALFGGGSTRASSVEISDPLSLSERQRRYTLGFTGRASTDGQGGQAFVSVGQSEKVLDFSWNNYSVKQ